MFASITPSHTQPIAPTALPNVLSMHTRGFKLEGNWPTLFWGPEVLPQIKRKVEQLPWAGALLDALSVEADTICTQEPELPIEPIGWRHDYYSPETGEHLLFNPKKAVHIDPWNQAEWHGEPFQKAWALLVHERTYRLMRNLACLYRLTGEERYGQWVVKGLIKAVIMFRHSDLRSGQHSALYYQPLYDSQMLALIANTCAFMQESPLYSSDLHSTITTAIFEDAMPYQIKFVESRGAHNMTCYVDAALLFAGLLLERQDWLNMAIFRPATGFFAMLDNGLACDQNGQIDGFWCESVFYHFYSLCPLLSVFAILHSNSLPELAAPVHLSSEITYKLARMLLAPAEMTDNQLRLPVFGDLGAPKHMKLSGYASIYEMGAGVLDNPALSASLGTLYGSGSKRMCMEALCFGPDELKEESASALSVHLPATGAVFIRDQGYQAYLKCGMPTASHDHADKLSFGLATETTPIIADLGTAGYANRAFHTYCRSAVAHSTIIVDDQTTQQVSEAGLTSQLEQHRTEGYICFDNAVMLQRQMELSVPYLRIEDTCAAPEPHVFTWLMHPYGSAAVTYAELGNYTDMLALPENGPFAYLANRQVFSTHQPVCIDWQVAENLYLRAWVKVSVPCACILAHSPGNPQPDRRTTLALCFQGSQVQVQTVLEIYTAQAQMSSAPDLLT